MVENYPFGGTSFLFFAPAYHFGTGPKLGSSFEVSVRCLHSGEALKGHGFIRATNPTEHGGLQPLREGPYSFENHAQARLFHVEH